MGRVGLRRRGAALLLMPANGKRANSRRGNRLAPAVDGKRRRRTGRQKTNATPARGTQDDATRTALWSSTDFDENGDGGEPLDANYDASDLAPEALATMRGDCLDFYVANVALIVERNAYLAGTDFWLTRNRHGAGFWDGGWCFNGKALSDAAHAYGETYLYIGDDGKIHHQ